MTAALKISKSKIEKNDIIDQSALVELAVKVLSTMMNGTRVSTIKNKSEFILIPSYFICNLPTKAWKKSSYEQPKSGYSSLHI